MHGRDLGDLTVGPLGLVEEVRSSIPGWTNWKRVWVFWVVLIGNFLIEDQVIGMVVSHIVYLFLYHMFRISHPIIPIHINNQTS